MTLVSRREHRSDPSITEELNRSSGFLMEVRSRKLKYFGHFNQGEQRPKLEMVKSQ